MLNDFNAFVKSNQLFSTKDTLLVAMSGGVDSMVLGHLLLELGVTFGVAHANFQLRGSESEADEMFVKDWADRNGIPVYTKRFVMASRSKGKSVQQAAREMRYQWFFQLLEQHEYNLLVTAHHATDNVETLFINLLRGAGIHGWSGIPIRYNQIVRPLIFASKEQIRAYAEQEGVGYREDATNSREYYLRNQIRLKVLPEFKQISPGFVKRISENQLQLQHLIRLLEKLVVEQNQEAVTRNKDGTIQVDLGKISPKEDAENVLYVLLREYRFSYDQICNAYHCETSGKRFYAQGFEMLVNRGRLLIRKAQSNADQLRTVKVNPDTVELKDPLHLALTIQASAGFTIPMSNRVAALDFEKLSFPLLLRPWRHGDRFTPLGMTGEKLISDFLIDAKVDQFEKEETYVLISGDEVVWLVGHRISESAKITPNTSNVLLLTLTE